VTEQHAHRLQQANAAQAGLRRVAGRDPQDASLDEAVKLLKDGRTVTQIAIARGIGRGSVYRALETCGIKQAANAALVRPNAPSDRPELAP
jgi:DNA invertase Pin-like site-specific DNA recombinase